MITKLSIISSFFAGLIGVFGDYTQTLVVNRWKLAFIDNSTHAIVAFFTWVAISFAHHDVKTKVVLEGLICALLASLLDTDHFITASSFSIKDATHLKSRPFLHNSTLVVGIFAFILTLSLYLGLPALWNFAWILLAAGLSHHVRDATRRGIWLWPIGSTPPIPYVMYVIILIILPHIISQIMRFTAKPQSIGLRIEMI